MLAENAANSGKPRYLTKTRLEAMKYAVDEEAAVITIRLNPVLGYSHEQITARYRQEIETALETTPEARPILDKLKFFIEDDPNVPQGDVWMICRVPYAPVNLAVGLERVQLLVEDYARWVRMDAWGGPKPNEPKPPE